MKTGTNRAANSSSKPVDTTGVEVGFLRSELDIGITLSRIASNTGDPLKAQRNRTRAREVYESTLRFMPKVNLTNEEADELQTKVAQLKTQLQHLGEDI